MTETSEDYGAWPTSPEEAAEQLRKIEAAKDAASVRLTADELDALQVAIDALQEDIEELRHAPYSRQVKQQASDQLVGLRDRINADHPRNP